MNNDKSRDPLVGMSASNGLHVLKDEWNQKDFMEAQCNYLAKNLSLAIKSTTTPRRIQGFNLDRGPNDKLDKSSREHWWEQSIWEAWRKSTATRVKDCWFRIVYYQVPLFDSDSPRWGHIDLLGIYNDGLPVIIELKKDPPTGKRQGTIASETPLRIVLEATAYAIALRGIWDLFRPEFVSHLAKIGIDEKIIRKVPQSLSAVRVVGAAPAAYWIDWLPVTPKGLQVRNKAWEAFRLFLEALGKEKLITSFVSIAGDHDRPETLAGQWLKGFPLIR
jgi:hypothetical protein